MAKKKEIGPNTNDDKHNLVCASLEREVSGRSEEAVWILFRLTSVLSLLALLLISRPGSQGHGSALPFDPLFGPRPFGSSQINHCIICIERPDSVLLLHLVSLKLVSESEILLLLDTNH